MTDSEQNRSSGTAGSHDEAVSKAPGDSASPASSTSDASIRPGASGAGAGSPAAKGPLDADARHTPRSAARAALVLALIGIVLAFAVGAWTYNRFDRIESELVRRLQGAEQRDASLQSALQQSQNLVRDLQNRSAVLESKAAETAGLQAQLEKLYRDRAEDSLEVLLVETEAGLTLAAQQLALGASPQAVLAALQDLEARIARQNEPRLASVQAAILRDIEKLRVYPASDVGSLALRIDALVTALDQLPLLASIRAPVETANGVVAPDSAPAPSTQPSSSSPSSSPPQPSQSSQASAPSQAPEAVQPADPPAESGSNGRARVKATLTALRDELRDLFSVRRIDSPDAVLLSPQQAYFLRQNLRLMLLNARLALLSRNEEVYRADLERARRWVGSYYDTEHRNVMAVQAQLRQLLEAKIVLDPPRIEDSLGAVRLARSAAR